VSGGERYRYGERKREKREGRERGERFKGKRGEKGGINREREGGVKERGRS
jgi:hypothetical protein